MARSRARRIPEKVVLVQLSDIHFTRSSGGVHDVDQTVRDELLRDVEALMKKLGAALGVLVTGDIAFSGKKEEYQHAAEWLRKVCEAIGCDARRSLAFLFARRDPRPRQREPQSFLAARREHQGSANLPDQHVLAEAVADDLRSALEQIESVLADFRERAISARSRM